METNEKGGGVPNLEPKPQPNLASLAEKAKFRRIGTKSGLPEGALDKVGTCCVNSIDNKGRKNNSWL